MRVIQKTFDELTEMLSSEIADSDVFAVRDISVPETNSEATKYFTVASMKTWIAAVGLQYAMRSGYVSLTANNPTPVLFSTEFSGTWFFVAQFGKDADGNIIFTQISNESSTGFTVEALSDCTFYYLAMVSI